MKSKRILLRDVKWAECEYAHAMAQWGERNLATARALEKWQNLKEQWRQNYASPKKTSNARILTRPGLGGNDGIFLAFPVISLLAGGVRAFF